MKDGIKILVVSPPFVKGFCRSQRWPVVNRARALRYPDWLAYAVAVLEREGHRVEFVDCIAEEMTRDDLGLLVAREQPEWVVMDVTTPSIFNDIECARRCKEVHPCKIVFVGTHASALPSQTLELAQGAVDFILRGEYDYSLLELVESSSRDLSKVLALSRYEGGKVINNPDRPPIEDLDSLPIPAWSHLNLKKYVNNIYDYPYLDMISGRGCPFRCTFCQWPQLMHGRKYRFRSAESVVDEMSFLFRNYPIREIFFEDDTLTANKDRLIKICEEILRRNLRVKWSCNSRCDFDDIDLFRLMKRAGCRMLLIGPESGSQEVLNRARKGVKLEMIRRFVNSAHETGLSLHSCYVIGLPGETRETIKQTIRFAFELDTDTIQVSSVMPMVGTELYRWAVKEGYLKAHNWDNYVSADGEQIPVMEYPHLSQKEMNEAVDHMLKTYYFRPRKMFNLLFRCTSFTELYAKFRGGYYLARYALEKERVTSGSLQ